MADDYSNFSILYDYYIEGAEYWLISDLGDLVRNREPLKKLLTALAVSTHVKYIEIRLNLLNSDEVALLANSLEKNTSVTALYIRSFTPNEEEIEQSQKAFERLFIALLSRIISLETLILYASSLDLECAKENCIEVIRNNTKLKRFDLNLQIGEEGVIKLIEQIGESCHNLTYLSIDSDVGPNVSFALAKITGKSRTLKTVTFTSNQDFEWNPSDDDLVGELIGTENKVLRYFSIPQLRQDLKIVEENKKNRSDKLSETINSNYVRSKAHEEWMNSLHSQEANFDLTKLPVDLMFAILVFTGDMASMQAFFKTNKYWRDAAKKHNFWKYMVNAFVPAIDPDVLAHADAFYAKNLEEFGAERANFWELLLNHSFHYTHSPSIDYFSLDNIDKFAQRLPFHHPSPSPYIHEQLLTAIFRRWPNASTHVQLIKVNSKRHSYCKMDKPYCWMQLSFGFTNLYHIILQTYANKKITGLFFICSNTQSFFNDPFSYVEQPMDYFVAESVEEALVKMKRMMDTWCGALGRKYEYSTRKKLVQSVMETAIEKHQLLQQEISKEVEQIASKIIERFNIVAGDVGKIIDLIEKTTKKLREQPIVFCNEISDRKYKLPNRYKLHLQYPKELLGNISFFEHNRLGNWGKSTEPITQQLKQKKRINKPSIKATLSKLVRIILNFVVMPILKALWPRQRSEVDNGYSRSYNRDQPDTTIVAYYFRYYKPLSAVTITDSYPKCWPITAVVMAKQILVKLGQLTEYLVSVALKRENTIEYNIDKLIEDLSHYDLIPQKHLNGLKIAINDLVREI